MTSVARKGLTGAEEMSGQDLCLTITEESSHPQRKRLCQFCLKPTALLDCFVFLLLTEALREEIFPFLPAQMHIHEAPGIGSGSEAGQAG